MSRGKWARCATCGKATYVCAKRRCLTPAQPVDGIEELSEQHDELATAAYESYLKNVESA